MDAALIAGAAAVSAAAAAVLTHLFLKRRARMSETGARAAGGPRRDLVDGHRPPDWSAVGAQLLGLARQAVGAEGVALLTPEDEGWKVALTSPGMKAAGSVPRREGLLALAVSGEREVSAESVHPGSLGYLVDRSGPVGVALVPAFHRGAVTALLACHRAPGKPFDEEELAVLKRCARLLQGWEAYAAYAEDVARQRDEGERLARGLASLSALRGHEALCDGVLEPLFDLLPAVHGFVAVQSVLFNKARLATRGFDPPPTFERLLPESWCSWVIRRGGEPLELSDSATRESAMPVLYGSEPFRPGAPVYLHPLCSPDEVFGVVGLAGKEDVAFDPSAVQAAARFVDQVAVLLRLAFLDEQVREKSIRDGLTNLFNRRYFQEEGLSHEVSRSQRDGAPLGLLFIDVDHFKRINDRYGHPAGDQVLRELARRIRFSLRDVDGLYRYGGEEFVALLPGCSADEAAKAAERVRLAVEALRPGEGGLPESMTVSLGVAGFPRPFPTAERLVKAADEAVYEAKRLGRNRVVVAGG